MKIPVFKSLVAIVLLAMIIMVNTGCPSSRKVTTPNDSTAGNPPAFHDSTAGNPPKKN